MRGPRATVTTQILTRSGSGDPELQSLGHAGARGGQAPALRCLKPAFYTVGRGPVPRHAWVVTATIRGFWVAGIFRFGR